MPAGWAVSVLARVPEPGRLAVTPDGELLVAQPRRGTVTEVYLGGAAPQRQPQVLLEGLDTPSDLAFARVGGTDWLYVAEADAVSRHRWTSGAPGPRAPVLDGLPGRGAAARSDGLSTVLAVDPAGVAYVSWPPACAPADASADASADGAPPGAVWAARPDGRVAVHAAGVGLAADVALPPGGGDPWVAVDATAAGSVPACPGRSGSAPPPPGGAARPAGSPRQAAVDGVHRLTAGDDLGWPWCLALPSADGGVAVGPSPGRPSAGTDCSEVDPPGHVLPVASRPGGLAPLHGTSVAAELRDGLAVVLRGPSDAEQPAPAVSWLPWPTGARGPLGSARPLLTGWGTPDGPWGRPVDVAVSPDGALLVSDAGAGAVLRLAPGGE